jgi:hypothetical protein
VTAADVHRPPRAAPPKPVGPALAGLRLTRLYLVSRRVPVALGLLAGLGVLLWAALNWHWNIAGGRAAQELIPLTVETGAAAIIAVTTYGPFGEQERTTGRWLPWLRLGAVVMITAVAVGVLAAGATGAAGTTGGYLPGGTLAMLRNLVGTTGTGLLCAAVFGGAFGWIGPMAYMLITEVALTGNPTTPWIWAARPPADLGGALCAYGVFAAGLLAVTVAGARGVSRLTRTE